jgi:hypothetical protein
MAKPFYGYAIKRHESGGSGNNLRIMTEIMRKLSGDKTALQSRLGNEIYFFHLKHQTNE